jgi:hypothetical protein
MTAPNQHRGANRIANARRLRQKNESKSYENTARHLTAVLYCTTAPGITYMS